MGRLKVKKTKQLPKKKVDSDKKLDKHSGHMLQRIHCKICQRCWLWIEGPSRGSCLYGGPFAGYEKVYFDGGKF